MTAVGVLVKKQFRTGPIFRDLAKFDKATATNFPSLGFPNFCSFFVFSVGGLIRLRHGLYGPKVWIPCHLQGAFGIFF